MEDKQQRNLRNYHHQARLLLTEREREQLHEMLKDYQLRHDARQFVSGLRSILNTPSKLDLLREIRNLVPPASLQEFDALAPYDHMAHPLPSHMFKESSAAFKRSPSWHGNGGKPFDTQSEDLDLSNYVGTGVRVLTIANKSEDLGFTIKGGSEQGTPVSVSRVERGSEAEKNGLVVGDEILEVNNINFEEIAISSAIRVLQGSSRLRMTVQNNPALVPSQHHSHRRPSKEKTKWFDTYSRSRGPPAGLNTSPPPAGSDRKVVIQLDEKHRCIGFNIRGGSEYGLGIFVSKIDRGGMAEHHRIKVGDQILSVNGTSCDSMSHAAAVELIRGQKRLVLTVRSMGPDSLNQSHSKPYRPPSATPSLTGSLQQQQQSLPFPNGPVPPIPKQNKDWLTRAQPHGGVQRLDVRDMKVKQLSPGEASSGLPSARQSAQGSLSGDGAGTERSTSRPPSVQSQISTQRQWVQQPPQSTHPQTHPLPHPQSQPQSRLQPNPQPNPQQYHQPHSRLLPQPHSQPNLQAHLQPHPQAHPQAHPQTHPQGGEDGGGKEKKRALGRSLSMKHPGERRLPVMRNDSKPKPDKVRRNKTFRELFGLKPKVKVHEKIKEEAPPPAIIREEVVHVETRREETEKENYLEESFREDMLRVDPIGQEAGDVEEDQGGEDKDSKRHRKGKGKMTGIIASFRKTRSEVVVKKRAHLPMEASEDDAEIPSPPERPESTTSWASRKDSQDRDSNSSNSHGSVGPQKGAFIAGIGTQVMHVVSSQSSQMGILVDEAKKVLNEDEVSAVLRHVKRYHGEGGVDSLVIPLLAILDKPEKVVLLREIRGVIAPLDLVVFDTMVSRKELDARNLLNAKPDSMSPVMDEDPKRQQADQPDSPSKKEMNNNANKEDKVKRHQNELERLRKQREEEVRQAKLNSSTTSPEADPTPYEHLSFPSNRSGQGSFETFGHGERVDQFHPQVTSFKGARGGGSPSYGTPQGSLSKKSAKRVLINSAPQIIRTNSAGDDNIPPCDDGSNDVGRGQDERDGHGDVFSLSGSSQSGTGPGWDPYETVPDFPRSGPKQKNGPSPKVQNTPNGKRASSPAQGAVALRSQGGLESPYASIKVNALADDLADTTDANESDRDSVDSDYSLGKKTGAYSLGGNEGEGVEGSSPILPLSPAKAARKLSPIPASPPTPRLQGSSSPPTSPTGAMASLNLDALLLGRSGQQQQGGGARDGTNSNRSSGSSSDDPVYAKVDKNPSRAPSNLLDVPDSSLDSASESDSGKRVSFSEFRGSPVAPRKGILKNSFNHSERPSVPIRNPRLYVDDSNDDEPSPLKEIMRRNRGRSPVKPVARRRIDGFLGREIFEFELVKSQSSLGLSLTGGKDYKNQPYVKVDKIYPGGAVAEDGTLASGCVLVGVEGESLLDVSHHQAMDIIRSAYTDPSRKTMHVEFMDIL